MSDLAVPLVCYTVRYYGLDVPGTAHLVADHLFHMGCHIEETDMVAESATSAVYFRVTIPDFPSGNSFEEARKMFELENALKSVIFEHYVNSDYIDARTLGLKPRDIDVRVDRDSQRPARFYFRGWLTATNRRGLIREILKVLDRAHLNVYGLRAYPHHENANIAIIRLKCKSIDLGYGTGLSQEAYNTARIDAQSLATGIKEDLENRTGVIRVEMTGDVFEWHDIPDESIPPDGP